MFWGGVCEKPRKNRCRIEMKSGDTQGKSGQEN